MCWNKVVNSKWAASVQPSAASHCVTGRTHCDWTVLCVRTVTATRGTKETTDNNNCEEFRCQGVPLNWAQNTSHPSLVLKLELQRQHREKFWVMKTVGQLKDRRRSRGQTETLQWDATLKLCQAFITEGFTAGFVHLAKIQTVKKVLNPFSEVLNVVTHLLFVQMDCMINRFFWFS